MSCPVVPAGSLLLFLSARAAPRGKRSKPVAYFAVALHAVATVLAMWPKQYGASTKARQLTPKTGEAAMWREVRLLLNSAARTGGQHSFTDRASSQSKCHTNSDNQGASVCARAGVKNRREGETQEECSSKHGWGIRPREFKMFSLPGG